MKPIRMLIVCLSCLLLFSCGTETEPAVMTGIYTAVAENMLPQKNTMRLSDVVPYGDGYAFLAYRGPDRNAEDPLSTTGNTIFHTDGDGSVIREISVSMAERSPDPSRLFVWAGGVFGCPLENDGYHLTAFDWEGNRIADILLKDVIGSDRIPDHLSIVAHEDGFALLSGKKCLYLDAGLQKTGETELPGNGWYLFADGDALWTVYREGEKMRLGKLAENAVTESYDLPLRFQMVSEYEEKAVAGVREGYVYGRDLYGLYRWQIHDHRVTHLCRFPYIIRISAFTYAACTGCSYLCGILFYYKIMYAADSRNHFFVNILLCSGIGYAFEFKTKQFFRFSSHFLTCEHCVRVCFRHQQA